MKCKGQFVFKSLTHRAGGTFKNENGDDVNYQPAYILKVDEVEGDEINERKFKIPEDKIVLINDLKTLEAYQKIILDFQLTIFTSRISLEPIGVDVDIDN